MSSGAHTAAFQKYGVTKSRGITPTMVRGRPSRTI
jgi:hypothetical protein